MSGKHVIVRFQLDHEDWHGNPNEGLWAEEIGESRYRLLNSPFFVRGVNYLDVVAAKPDEDGQLHVSGVVFRGGHSTYMVLAEPDSGEFDEFWGKMKSHGCSYESMTKKLSIGNRVLYSVDVPPEADIYSVYALLEDAERKGVLMFQEGHCGHTLRR